MKTITSFLFLLLITFSPAIATPVCSSSTTVKPFSGFSFFRVHRQGSGISLSWASSSSGVVQFIIERSYDGEFFDVIAGIGCNGANTHRLSDNNVFPGIIYYRVTAIKADGTTESSATETVRFVRRG
ncbi:MAG TPA: hypothetical protein VNA26_00605 [Chitinophagaceae bacterium]|nr:hypothetical protein [Chitinophagaceae bacterium]